MSVDNNPFKAMKLRIVKPIRHPGCRGALTFLFLMGGLSIGYVGSLIRGTAQDWPFWRGPDRSGIVSGASLLERWPAEGPKVLWKAKVGLGFSSFAVSSGRAVTLGHADEKDTVICFDAVTGQELWKHSYPAELGDKYFEGGTTGTPVIDGDRVYVLSRWGDLIRLNLGTGATEWSKNIARETGARIPDWGFGGAPLVLGKLLILNVGDAGVAVDKATGKVLWKSEASSAAYATPVPVTRGGVLHVIFGSARSYVAVAAADGKEVWRIRWLTEYGVNAADPIVQGDKIFLSTGYGKGAGLFEWKEPEPAPLWKSKVLRTQMNAAILFEDHLYGVDGDTTEKASLKCVELTTGKEKWMHAGFGSGGMLIAGGQIIALSGTGELILAPATPAGFRPTSRAQVLGGKCWTAPVIAAGRLYVRNSRGDVTCLQVGKP